MDLKSFLLSYCNGIDLLVWLHIKLAPFTKVEESFNMQAVHDIMKFGIQADAIQHYDHLEFPGVVPRTCLGALCLAPLTRLLDQVKHGLFTYSMAESGLARQTSLRLMLGFLNCRAISHFIKTIIDVYGFSVACWFVVMQLTQFHLLFYMGRTLPNMLAFGLTTLAACSFVTHNANLTPGFILLTIAAVFFRIEIVLLFLCNFGYHLFITRRARCFDTVKACTVTAVACLVLTAAVDSYFWQRPVIPELTSVFFNVVQGKSSDWGTRPFYAYALDLIKLLLNPLAVPLIMLATRVDRRVRHILAPALAFVAIYSLQPHKEWRFIIYVVPQLTLAAAIGANYLFQRRAKTLMWRLAALALVLSIPATAIISLDMLYFSSFNYPGGVALQRLSQQASSSMGTVYLDTLTCMTGATRFLQDAVPAKFTKEEDSQMLASHDFWQSLDYAILESSTKLVGNATWRPVADIEGLRMASLRSLKIEPETKLTIWQNHMNQVDGQ